MDVDARVHAEHFAGIVALAPGALCLDGAGIGSVVQAGDKIVELALCQLSLGDGSTHPASVRLTPVASCALTYLTRLAFRRIAFQSSVSTIKGDVASGASEIDGLACCRGACHEMPGPYAFTGPRLLTNLRRASAGRFWPSSA